MGHRRKKVTVIVATLTIIYLLAGWHFAFKETGAFDQTYGFPVLKGGDSYSYAFLAENLVRNRVYSSREEPPYTPEVLRSPGYSFFLAPFSFLFDSFIPVVFVQFFLVIVSSLLVYEMGRRLFSEKAGFVAALVFGLNPAIIFYVSTILSDILFVFLFLLSIYLLFFRFHASLPRLYLAAFFGMATLGYAILVRPAGLYSVGIIFPFVLWHYTRHIGIKRAVLIIFFSAIVFASALLPWYLRNYYHSGSMTLSPIGPYTLLFYNVAGFLAGKEGGTMDSAKQKIKMDYFPGIDTSELQTGLHAGRISALAKDYILGDPVGYFLYHIRGSVNFFLASSFRDISNESAVLRTFLLSTPLLEEDNVSLKDYLKKDGIVKGSFAIAKSELLFTAERAWWFFIMILAFIAPVLFWKKPEKRELILLFFFLVGYFALIYGPVSYPRYRIASEPFLILLASGSLWFVGNALRAKFSEVRKLSSSGERGKFHKS